MIACSDCGANLLDETAVCPVCQTSLPAVVKKKRQTPTPSQQRNRLLWPWLIYLAACAIQAVSYFCTPMSSGIPASFGNIIQPLVLFGAIFITLVLGIILIILSFIAILARMASRPDASLQFRLLVEKLLLVLNTLQLFFALFGPNL